MSVFKNAKSPFWQYDFIVSGRRFFGSTKAKLKKAAERIEGEIKEKAKADIEHERKTGSGPMTLDAAAGRYMQEVGNHHKRAPETYRDIAALIAFFGKDTRLDVITDTEVAKLIAWKRVQPDRRKRKLIKGQKSEVRIISPSTVNRTTLVHLKAIFLRARKVWRQSLPLEPNWREHWLKEPEERIRELYDGEGEALDAACRDDYADWFEFARLTGLRRNETIIRWENVNTFGKVITTIGKRGLIVRTPITSQIKAILERSKGHHSEFVFTFICQQTSKDKTKIRGQRYPITPEGAKTQWRRLKAKSGVKDFRFHDIRHDVGTKLLRATGNLKLVQKALNHRDIKTTTRYAHVQNEEVASAMEALAESRKKSQTKA